MPLNEDIAFVSDDAVTEATPDYAAGDTIGGLLQFEKAVVANGGTARLRQVILHDKAAQAGVLTLILFNANPSESTITDNAALSIHDDDVGKIIAKIPIAAADYTALAASSVAVVAVQQLIKLADTNGILYGVLMAGGAINLASTSDYRVTLALERLYP